MLDILIRNCTAVTMDDEKRLLTNAFIGVKDGKIVWLSEKEPEEKSRRVIDGSNKIAMPGLINTHSHAAMALMRGYADDYALQDWLYKYVFPTEAKLTPDAVYWGMQLAMTEMLACGTVSITDMYMYLPAMARSVCDAGIYGNLSNGAMCFDPSAYCFETDGVTAQNRECLQNYHGFDAGRVKIDVSVHAEYTSFPQLWQDFSRFARENGMNMHIHLSETKKEHEECVQKYGKTPAHILAENGIFDTRTTAAHCVWVTEEDMELLREKDVTVAHNPVSNLKLASGTAPVSDMLKHGVRVALGTDGVCSNNNHDLFEEIKLAAILQKGRTGDPRVVNAYDALYMATRAGAYAQGREQELGQLKEGFDASLILIDTDKPNLIPVHHPLSTLAYSAHGSDVCLTMIRGKVLYENGVYSTIDLERVKKEFRRVMEPLFKA